MFPLTKLSITASKDEFDIASLSVFSGDMCFFCSSDRPSEQNYPDLMQHSHRQFVPSTTNSSVLKESQRTIVKKYRKSNSICSVYKISHIYCRRILADDNVYKCMYHKISIQKQSFPTAPYSLRCPWAHHFPLAMLSSGLDQPACQLQQALHLRDVPSYQPIKCDKNAIQLHTNNFIDRVFTQCEYVILKYIESWWLHLH